MSIALAESASRSRGQDLALRHRYGDPAAFDEVYQRFAEMVYGLALRMSGDREEAADMSQEVFLRVYRHLGRFRGRSSLKTWIYRITINCCRSALRKRSRRYLEGPLDNMEELADQRTGPEERTLGHDLGRRLAEAVGELPVVFREAVLLRDVQGLSYGEIGEVLGVRIGTVRSRIARGRERLRALMEESE
jgi:RNA polymerase sigma-70 factor (ECF subfamily)